MICAYCHAPTTTGRDRHDNETECDRAMARAQFGFSSIRCPKGHGTFKAYGQPRACQTCGWIDPEPSVGWLRRAAR